MELRTRKIGLLVLALSGSLVCPAPAAARGLREEPGHEDPKKEAGREASPSADLIGPALEKRIRGQASLDDVRIDVGWSSGAVYASARIYGNGIVVCDGKLQFSAKKEAVLSILKDLRKARFGSMPPYYGESEGDERKDGPRLKGSLAVRAGSILKTVQQLVDGEQSEQLEALAKRILEVCRGSAQKGTGASSLDDGLDKLGSRALASETLQVILQRRADGPDKTAGETTWILELEGRRVTDQLMPPGQKPPLPRLLVLPEADFLSLVRLLAEAHLSEIPINVYEPRYTDLRVTVLNRSRFISGRRFLNMTAETHGEKQKAFDRLYEALRALHERVQKEGKTVSVPASLPATQAFLPGRIVRTTPMTAAPTKSHRAVSHESFFARSLDEEGAWIPPSTEPTLALQLVANRKPARPTTIRMMPMRRMGPVSTLAWTGRSAPPTC